MQDASNTIGFFRFARERYRIFLRRMDGEPLPWTKDPILQSYRFCNIFREDDTTTMWIANYVRCSRIIQQSGYMIYAMALCRFVNRISSLELINEQPSMWYQPPHKLRKVLRDAKPLVTGAYMVKTPTGMDKLDGLIEILEPIWEASVGMELNFFADGNRPSLRDVHEKLIEFPFVGGFMAYEIVTDLRHTPLLSQAPDIDNWCNLGPGAVRGLGRVLANDPGTFRNVPNHTMLEDCWHLLKMAWLEEYWPGSYPRWEMREVEHTLCEYDKYERTRLGEGSPKQRYGGRGDDSNRNEERAHGSS